MNSLAANKEKMLAQAWTVPLKEMDISNWYLTEYDVIWPYFERLRKEDPVHYTEDSRYGSFWSITRFNDIKFVDQNHKLFSSQGSIGIEDQLEEFTTPMFIAMDPPKHDAQRKAVSPVVAPSNLAELEPLIRSRVETILEGLPIGETFNWVDRVSIELTTQMLATLFNFPFEDRHLLTRWSDIATGGKNSGHVNTTEDFQREMMECLAYFTRLWRARENETGGFDLISMMANNEDTKDVVDRPLEYLGNLILLIVGGNDTTRNSISGGVLALNKFPEQYDKLNAKPALIPNMVAEIIRWQTPLAFMRRTALEDVEMHGKQIKKGDKVVMWYASGNRDEETFEDAGRLIIDRPNARNHVSFGFGIHRCMGNRLAEMQLRVLWEEIQRRFRKVEVVGEPVRNRSAFVRGYSELPVKLIPLGLAVDLGSTFLSAIWVCIMEFDLMTGANTWKKSAELASQLERAGFSGMLFTEAGQVPWMMIAAAANAAPSLNFTTGIAVAFPRSPMMSAQIAWELAQNTEGRFRLGLGSQVKGHIERRYSAYWDKPAPQMRDYVNAFKACIRAFRQEEKLHHEGPYYNLSLLPGQWSPGRHDYEDIKIDISAVGPYMCKVAGELCDGLHVHPMHSMTYINTRLLPDLQSGADRSGRSAGDIDLIIPVFAIPGDSPEERQSMINRTRMQISFYGSTPNYSFQFDDLGYEGTTQKLGALMKQGDIPAMANLISDEMLEHFALVARWDDMADTLIDRYQGIASRVVTYLASEDIHRHPENLNKWGEIAKAVRQH